MPIIGSRAGASARGFGFSGLGIPSVSGGTLLSDATYYYRLFTSNGTLTVTNGNLPCDVLIISGGGAGSNGQYKTSAPNNLLLGGGGGAGGTKQFTTSLSPSAHAVVIGAGGNQSVGSNSSVGALSTTGGGWFQTDGGSGAGATGWLSNNVYLDVAAGAGVSGEGNAGGGFSGAYNSYTGGGGGAGGAGGINAGGNGTSAYSSWLSAIESHMNSNIVSDWGTVTAGYIAGGGGGGRVNGSSNGGSGGGGKGGYNNLNVTAGKINTGSGGGGQGSTTSTAFFGYNGGSGLVIVRYLKTAVA